MLSHLALHDLALILFVGGFCGIGGYMTALFIDTLKDGRGKDVLTLIGAVVGVLMLIGAAILVGME